MIQYYTVCLFSNIKYVGFPLRNRNVGKKDIFNFISFDSHCCCLCLVVLKIYRLFPNKRKIALNNAKLELLPFNFLHFPSSPLFSNALFTPNLY